jgi:DNA-binding NarL/FixJ family response regulator
VTGSLTVRQVQVLALVAKGMTNYEIGRTLHLTEETVKRHVKDIRCVLAAPDRASAVDPGWRRGYLGMWRVGMDWSVRPRTRSTS